MKPSDFIQLPDWPDGAHVSKLTRTAMWSLDGQNTVVHATIHLGKANYVTATCTNDDADEAVRRLVGEFKHRKLGEMTDEMAESVRRVIVGFLDMQRRGVGV